MNFRTRTNNITKILYAILILCVAGIMVLSVYSLFNQNNSRNKNNGSLNNIEGVNSNKNDVLENNTPEDEEALKNFYKTQTTESQTQPQTTKRNVPQTTTTSYTEPLTPPVIEDEEQIIPTDKTDKTDKTEKKADSAVDPTEKAVEVIYVPVIYIKPVNGYLSKLHNLDTPEYSVAMNDYRTHAGIDIDSDIGTNVKAVYDGIITEIKDDPLMGKTIVITHPNNMQSIYMNLQEAVPKNISPGTEVKCGDIIGGVGETALIEIYDVPHLHFEMKKDGNYVNPLDYIEF